MLVDTVFDFRPQPNRTEVFRTPKTEPKEGNEGAEKSGWVLAFWDVLEGMSHDGQGAGAFNFFYPLSTRTFKVL